MYSEHGIVTSDLHNLMPSLMALFHWCRPTSLQVVGGENAAALGLQWKDALTDRLLRDTVCKFEVEWTSYLS
jgi:hypothetical protein